MRATGTLYSVAEADVDRITAHVIERAVDDGTPPAIVRAAVGSWIEHILDTILDDPDWLMRHFTDLDDHIEWHLKKARA